MKFEYIKVSHHRDATGKYKFYDDINNQDKGITIDSLSDIVQVLNYYGEDGWELVHMIPNVHLIFKRQGVKDIKIEFMK